jgi:hypothetical protein
LIHLIQRCPGKPEIGASKTKPEPDLDTRYRDRWQRKKPRAKRPVGKSTTSEREILYNRHTPEADCARFDSQFGRSFRMPHLRVPPRAREAGSMSAGDNA